MDSDISTIEFRNITKSFPGVTALDKVGFSVKKGEVHALVGENGAGKSTLLNLLHGVYGGYRGEIFINGKEINFKNIHDAIKFGIAKVHQEIALVAGLSIGQNIFLGYEPQRGPFIDYPTLHEQASQLLQRLKCNLDPHGTIEGISVGEMQMLSIAKALFHNASVISFDEPTSSLSNRETETLFNIINDLKKHDITIIYVSHRLEEVFQIADRVTVLRDGKYIGTFPVNEINRAELIRKMVGREVAAFAKRQRPRIQSDKKVLEVNHLTRTGVFDDVSFHLNKSEILGFSGLVGSKRTDVVRTIFGADPKSKGEVYIHGKKVDIKSPQEALKLSIGLIPENRKTEGFVKFLTNEENISLTCLDKFENAIFLDHKAKRKNSRYYIDKINLVPPEPSYITDQLSGGNQQKVVIAKWLSTQANILILDEPTKGIDIGAKEEIYRLLEDLISEGKSVIMISSELTEIIGMCDRVIIMHEGKKMKELSHEELAEEKILHYAMGGGK